jgi:putative FmdB family regulatory protein
VVGERRSHVGGIIKRSHERGLKREVHMPTYEYRCPNCKTEFELKRPMSESDKPAVCPKCGAQSEKLISGFASKTGSYLQGAAKPFRKETG